MIRKHALLFGLFLILSCSIFPFNLNYGFINITDYWPTNGWLSISPEELDVNSELLNSMDSFIERKLIGLDSIIVIKDGFIIKEKYIYGWNSDKPHELYSCTKSFTSALIGIAIDRDYLNINDTILDIFADTTFQNLDERKEKMTVGHLLRMQSGLLWDEWDTTYENPENPVRKMMESNDWVQYVLNNPMAAEPGTTWVYNTGVSHVLSAVIQEKSSKITFNFAQEYLFDPLGINPGYWKESPEGVVCGGAFLQLTPRDMAKLGYLYLNNGSWDGKQIISAEWINQSVNNYMQIDINGEKNYYGYQWWIYPDRYNYFTYGASGYMGQIIKCIPTLNLIVVCTGSTIYPNWDPLITNFIIPAIENKENSSVKEKNVNFADGFMVIFALLTLLLLIRISSIRKRRKKVSKKLIL